MLPLDHYQRNWQIVTSHRTTPATGEFELGIAEIDSQHRKLNDLLERLRDSSDRSYGHAVNAILAELDIHTRIHFGVEESLMRLLAFPDADAHVLEHRQLTEQLDKFRQRAQNFDISDGLSSFIQTWLIDHINNYDRKFVAHFLSKGIDPVASPEVERIRQ